MLCKVGDILIIIYVLIRTKLGMEHEIAAEIQKIRGVSEARVVYGEWDIVVRAIAEDAHDMGRIVSTIRKIEGVRRTITLVT